MRAMKWAEFSFLSLKIGDYFENYFQFRRKVLVSKRLFSLKKSGKFEIFISSLSRIQIVEDVKHFASLRMP